MNDSASQVWNHSKTKAVLLNAISYCKIQMFLMVLCVYISFTFSVKQFDESVTLKKT